MEIHDIFLAEERHATLSLTLKQHLVILEIGLLQDYLGTIRECQFLVAKRIVLCLFDNLTLGGQLSDQRFFLHIIDPGCECLSAHGLCSLLHSFGSQVSLTLFLLLHLEGHEVLVIHTDNLLCKLVDNLERQLLSQHVHRLIVILYRRNGIILKEVLDITIGELIVLHLVAVGVLLLQGAQVVSLGTGELSGSEAEVMDALGLAYHGLQGLNLLTLLSHTDEQQSILSTGHL